MKPTQNNSYKDHSKRKVYYKNLTVSILCDSSLKDNPEDKYLNFLLSETEQFVKDVLKQGVTKTQLRNIFETFKKCDSNSSMQMLKPKLIYTAGRLTNSLIQEFIFELVKVTQSLNGENDFQKLKKYIEAVLAYHKYYAKS